VLGDKQEYLIVMVYGKIRNCYTATELASNFRMDLSIEPKFTLTELEKLNIPINKRWFYRNCIPIVTCIDINCAQNVYTLKSIQEIIQRKRDKLKKHYSYGDIVRHKAEHKLVLIEYAINKFFKLKEHIQDNLNEGTALNYN